MENLVIVGSGPAGYTAAIYAARASLKPILLTGNLPGGLLTQTNTVENFPGFPDGILGFDLMENMSEQAKKFGTDIRFGVVKNAELGLKNDQGGVFHKLTLSDGAVLETRAVIIAAGSRPRELGVPGETELKAHGVSYCATCDGAFWRDVPICVVGGGDSAMEEAIFLTRFASEVHLVHRRDEFRASSVMANRVLENKKIIVHWNSVVNEIRGVAEKKVRGVQLKDTKDGHMSDVVCSAVFMAIGHVPSTEIFEGKLNLEHGYVLLAGESSTATSVEGIFAAGDCVDHVYQQAITAAASGCQAALDVQHWLVAQ